MIKNILSVTVYKGYDEEYIHEVKGEKSEYIESTRSTTAATTQHGTNIWDPANP